MQKSIYSSLAILASMAVIYFIAPGLSSSGVSYDFSGFDSLMFSILEKRREDWAPDLGQFSINFLCSYALLILLLGKADNRTSLFTLLLSGLTFITVTPIELVKSIFALVLGIDLFNENIAVVVVLVSIWGLALVMIRTRWRTFDRFLLAVYLTASLVVGCLFHIVIIHMQLKSNALEEGRMLSNSVLHEEMPCANNTVYRCWAFEGNNIPDELVQNISVQSIINDTSDIPDVMFDWIGSEATFRNPSIIYFLYLKHGVSRMLIEVSTLPTVIRDWASVVFNILLTSFIFTWWFLSQIISSFHRPFLRKDAKNIHLNI